MFELGVYEVTWTTESGGRPRLTEDEVVAQHSGEALEVAYSDYYYLGPVECVFIREATEDEVYEYTQEET
jgi:hypothetical protein